MCESIKLLHLIGCISHVIISILSIHRQVTKVVYCVMVSNAHVMSCDVHVQEDIRMRMREWTEYYEVVRPRKKVLNVISLEFSDTE